MKPIKTAIISAMVLALGTGSSLAMNKDIVDTAAGNADFETLVAAVQAAGLVDTLKGEGPFTVFAPTDDAFAALGSTVDEQSRLQWDAAGADVSAPVWAENSDARFAFGLRLLVDGIAAHTRADV